MMEAEALEHIFNIAARHAISYRGSITERPQGSRCNFAEMRKRFAAPLPETGEAGADVIDELARLAEPGLNGMTGSRFFGWIIGASHPVGVAADWLTSAWGQNSGNLQASPAAAAAEDVAAQWLLELLDLPRECSIGFVTGATLANFACLAAARGAVLRRAGWDADRDGLFGAPPINVLIGDDAHTTVFSALRFLGLGHDRVHRIATDDNGRMITEDFARHIAESTDPIIAIAQAGQINTGALDDVGEMAKLCTGRNAWLHVDGAFGLWARACPERAHLAAGLEHADSWATDGHKWLQTPYDCGYAIVRDVDAHRRAMASTASYLPDSGEAERDPTHYVPELSRRARGFATWAIIKALGRTGIAEMVARHCRVAQLMAERLGRAPGIKIMNSVVLNQAIIRFGADQPGERGDELTKAVIEQVQKDGVCFVGGASWRGRWVMRLSVISGPTTEEDGLHSAEAILRAWDKVRK